MLHGKIQLDRSNWIWVRHEQRMDKRKPLVLEPTVVFYEIDMNKIREFVNDEVFKILSGRIQLPVEVVIKLRDSQFHESVTAPSHITDPVQSEPKIVEYLGRGNWRGGSHPPYGFSVKNHKLVPDENEQLVLRIIKGKFDAGRSCSEIRSELNQSGIAPRSERGANGWRVKTIKRIIAIFNK